MAVHVDVGVRELRDGLSRHLASVKGGEVVTVTEHGRPIARIVPIMSTPRRTLAELEAEGAITPSKRPKGPLRPPVKAREIVSDLIAEQRR